MTDTAFQIQYRDEYIMGFERHQSLLRDTVTTEAVIKGNQATFLVVDSGGAEAVTRGTNGLIPGRPDNNTQTTATLQEFHDKPVKTNFNIFASQGNQRQIMQMTTMAVMNRKIDSQIITTLNTGTVAIGAGAVPTVSLFQNAVVKLQNASVPWDSNITLAASPSFLAYLEQTTEFGNAQYVNVKPYAGDEASWRDKPMAYRWRNCLIITHPGLPGIGTASEISFMYHKSSIGHAVNKDDLQMEVGYNGEHGYSWARCGIDMGAVLLQNAGVVVITTTGTEYA